MVRGEILQIIKQEQAVVFRVLRFVPLLSTVFLPFLCPPVEIFFVLRRLRNTVSTSSPWADAAALAIDVMPFTTSLKKLISFAANCELNVPALLSRVKQSFTIPRTNC